MKTKDKAILGFAIPLGVGCLLLTLSAILTSNDPGLSNMGLELLSILGIGILGSFLLYKS